MMTHSMLLDITNDMERLGIKREVTINYLYKTGRGYDDLPTQKQCSELLDISRARLGEIEDIALHKVKTIMRGPS